MITLIFFSLILLFLLSRISNTKLWQRGIQKEIFMLQKDTFKHLTPLNLGLHLLEHSIKEWDILILNFYKLQRKKMLLKFQISLTNIPFALVVKKTNIASFLFTFQIKFVIFPLKKFKFILIFGDQPYFLPLNIIDTMSFH